MKIFWAAKFVAIMIAVLLMTADSGCKNPYDYQPPFDSLTPPPPPPELIFPPHDTTFRYNQYPQNVLLQWHSVEGAEHYELQIATTPEFDGEVTTVYDTTYTLTVNRNGYRYWHVRGYSRNWEWYTEWSDTWRFYTWRIVLLHHD